MNVFTNTEIKNYLDRINYSGPTEATKQVLDTLVYAHQIAVPFETLDTHDFGKLTSLDYGDIYDKIVNRRRGGYCLELNGSFFMLLKSIGFDVRPCLCRVILGNYEDDFDHPIDHRITMVNLDGKRYICDVGLGGPMPSVAIDFDCREWQTEGFETYKIREDVPGWYALVRKTKGKSDCYNEKNEGERVELLVSDIICYDNDFIFLNEYMSTNPNAIHVAHRILNRRTEEGYCAILDDEFKEVRDGEVVTVEITEENLQQILAEKFGIRL